MDYFEKIKKHTQKTVNTKISDHKIGMSFAIGTFLCILPTPGFSIILGLTLAFALRLPKIAMIFSFLIFNPFVTALLAVPSITLGRLLLTNSSEIADIGRIAQIFNATKEFFVGNIIIAAYLALLGYFVIRLVVKLARLEREILARKRSEKKNAVGRI